MNDLWEIYNCYANLMALLEPAVVRGKIIKTFETSGTEYKPAPYKTSFLLELLVQKNFLPRSNLKILFGFSGVRRKMCILLINKIGPQWEIAIEKVTNQWLLHLHDELGRQHGKLCFLFWNLLHQHKKGIPDMASFVSLFL